MNAVGMPYIVSNSGKPTGSQLTRVPVDGGLSEDWLQQVLHHTPNLLPVSEFDDRVVPPLHSLGREIPTPVGPIDNLFISENGYVCLVETKLWKNPEARRTVIAQVLDYAAQVRTWTYSDLDRVWKKHGGGVELSLHKALQPQGYDEHEWIDRVNRSLSEGRMALAVVGDGIRTELHTLASAVAGHPGFQYRLALIEMRIFEWSGQRIIVPVTAARTVEIERAVVRVVTQPEQQPQITVDISPTTDGSGAVEKRAVFSEENLRLELLRLPNGPRKADAATRLLERLQSTEFEIEWKSAGVAIKMAEPTGSGDRLSLAVLNKTGRIFAYVPWLQKQLQRVWNNETAVADAVAAYRVALAQTPLKPVGTGLEIAADIADLDGREEDFVTQLESVASAISVMSKHAMLRA